LNHTQLTNHRTAEASADAVQLLPDLTIFDLVIFDWQKIRFSTIKNLKSLNQKLFIAPKIKKHSFS